MSDEKERQRARFGPNARELEVELDEAKLKETLRKIAPENPVSVIKPPSEDQ